MNISGSDRGLETIRPPVFDELDGIEAWFTLKNGDHVKQGQAGIPGLNLGSNTLSPAEDVSVNRTELFNQIGSDTGWVALAGQVHGSRVQFVSAGGTYPETDALVTDIPGLTLAIQVADCAALLLADPESGIIGAVHAGWRGAAGDIVPAAIDVMKKRGSRPSDLRAWISPCLSLENFEVGEEVAVLFPNAFIHRKRFDKPHLDLKGFLCSRLLSEGVSRDYIEVDGSCTVRDADLFYSYRREKEQSGRMMGIIRIGD